MKIAIFQNFLDTIGGAEVVGLEMAREFNADIYTTNIDREKIAAMGFSDIKIHSIGKVPINAPYRQQMTLWRFSRLNLGKKYDFYIINGDWAVSSAAHHSPNLWYVNATIREIWDLRKYVRKNNVSPFKKPLFDLWVLYNRYLNKKHIRHIERIASNSTFTQKRVEKYLKRNSEVIYPPVRTKKFHTAEDKKYWLSVNRLIAYKRVDMQLQAFAQMPDKKLIIIGPYEKSKHCQQYADYIHKTKTDNIVILDKADSFEELAEYYAHCTGFITTCHQEDFGMTAIEAMASGKMVIAPDEGGYKESIINNETGSLIDAINPEKIVNAVNKIESILTKNREISTKKCQQQAAKFSTEVFVSKIRKMMVK